MLNSILDQERGPWTSNVIHESAKSRPLVQQSVFSEEEGEDGDLAMFGSFVVDEYEDEDCQNC